MRIEIVCAHCSIRVIIFTGGKERLRCRRCGMDICGTCGAFDRRHLLRGECKVSYNSKWDIVNDWIGGRVSGYSKCRLVSDDGIVLYSYGLPIAVRTKGQFFVRRASRKVNGAFYSNTTSKHVTDVLTCLERDNYMRFVRLVPDDKFNRLVARVAGPTLETLEEAMTRLKEVKPWPLISSQKRST